MLPVLRPSSSGDDPTALAAELKRLTQTHTALVHELRPLQQAFEAFDAMFTKATAQSMQEVTTLEATCARLESYADRLHARILSDPTHVLGDVFMDDELIEIGRIFGVDIPDEWFERTTPEPSGQTAEASPEDDDEAWTDEIPFMEQKIPKRMLDKDDRDTLKHLYRKLAKQLHPDLARNEEERLRRQHLMHLVNRAWHERNLPTLRQLEHRLDGLGDASNGDVLAWHSLALRDDIERLRVEVEDLRARRRKLRMNPSFPLWFDASMAKAAVERRRKECYRSLVTLRRRRREAELRLRAAIEAYLASR